MIFDESKLNNLEKLDFEDVKKILYKCIDVLGVHDIGYCKSLLGVNRSRVYQIMDKENTFKIGSHVFLMTNIYIKKTMKLLINPLQP